MTKTGKGIFAGSVLAATAVVSGVLWPSPSTKVPGQYAVTVSQGNSRALTLSAARPISIEREGEKVLLSQGGHVTAFDASGGIRLTFSGELPQCNPTKRASAVLAPCPK